MVIRNIDETDTEQVADLFAACFSAEPWNEPWTSAAAHSRIAPMIRSETCRGAVAIHEQKIVGMAFGQVEGWINGNLFLLQEMCVMPNSQRTGLGKLLLDFLVKEIADRDNIIAIYLLTNRDAPAASFYSKHHFSASPEKVVMGSSVRSFLDAKSA